MRTTCRVCKRTNIIKVLDLGETPLANAYKKKPDSEAQKYPLQVFWCTDCFHVQLGEVIDPKILFTDYLYVSSTSPVFVKHFEDFAQSTNAKFVVDIGSNDGILLKPFKKKGCKVLGIEPSEDIATHAKKDGIPTLQYYFSSDLARSIVCDYGKADFVTATNVFAHIDDLDDVIEGVKELLTEDGTFVVEVPYVLDMFSFGSFDLIYHEHLSYWSVKALQTLFSRFGMIVVRVEHTNVHGGSIRVYVKRCGIPVDELEPEIRDKSSFLQLQQRIDDQRVILQRMLKALKSQGKSIVGYGAPAKTTTLIHVLGLSEYFDYVVDDSPLKQGRFIPGTNIPIVSAESLTSNPDYILLLAWNFADSIMKKYPGRKWILPFPTPRVI